MKSPIKYFGGKSYIADQIVGLFPWRSTNKKDNYINYVEPYCGGASVFFAATNRHKCDGCSEILNDKWGFLVNFFSVLREKDSFEEFHRRICLTPFNETDFGAANDYWNFHEGSDRIDDAVAFFICNRMSWAGRMEDFAALTKNRLRGGRNEQVNAWLGCIDKLPEIALRLQDALILNRDTLDVINQFDGEQTLFYLDPPYLLDTRTNNAGGEYAWEMDIEEHLELLTKLIFLKGRFLLSCYENRVYDGFARDYEWKRHEIKCVERSSGAANERIEIVYTNY